MKLFSFQVNPAAVKLNTTKKNQRANIEGWNKTIALRMDEVQDLLHFLHGLDQDFKNRHRANDDQMDKATKDQVDTG